MKRILLAAALAAASLLVAAQPGQGEKRDVPSAESTPGWKMMTDAERTAHREKMASMKNPAECRKYMEEHHKQMAERATQKGEKIGPMSADRGCGGMMKDGMMKDGMKGGMMKDGMK